MNIKKLFVIIGISTLISLTAFAETFDIKNGVPSDWIVYETEAKAEKASKDGEDGILINVKTDGGTSMAAVTTGKTDLSGDMTMSFRMSLTDDGGKGMRIMYLNDAVPVITVTGADITVFDLPAFSAEADKLFDFDISYKADTKAVKVWLDGALVAEGTTETVAGYNIKNSAITISSYVMGETADASWFFSKICLMNNSKGKLLVYPLDNEAVMADSIEAVWADFGVLTSYGTKNGGTVELYKNGEEEIITVSRDESKLILTPENGFSEGCKYRVVIKDGFDVFGNSISDIDYEFTTVKSGYEEATVKITAPENGKKLLAGEEILIEAEVTKGSEEIAKAELYEDGKLIMTDTDAPYCFNYSGDVGTREIKVTVTDSIGGIAESESITLQISENSAPVVTIQNVVANSEVLMNNNLEVGISDENDNIDYVKAFVDGVELEAVSDTVFKYPDTIALGKHTLSVYAYDTAGAVGRREVTAYFTRAEIETEVIQDMSTYTAVRSEAKWPAGMYGSLDKDDNGVHGYVESDERGGKKAMAIGEEENRKGKSTYFGITWLGGTDMPKEQFTCSMNIWFDDIMSQLQSVLRSNEETVRFSQQDVIFKNGILSIYDGGSVAKTIDYEANKWYNLKLEYNIRKGTYSCWFDGKQVADNYALQIAVPDVSLLRFHYSPQTNNASELCITDFEAYDITPYPYLISTDADENGLSLDAKEIKAVFNKETGTSFVLEKVQLMAGEGEKAVENYSYSSDASAIYAKMLDYPDNSTEYKLLVTGKYMGLPVRSVITFKSAAGGFDAYNTGFTESAQGVSFFADMQNDTGVDKNALVLIIKYEDGIMTASQSAEATVGSDGARITTPAVTTDGTDVDIIAVIWDSWSSRKPLNNNIYTYRN